MADIDLNNLDFSNVGSWPVAVKSVLIIIVAMAVLVLGYFVDIQSQQGDLERIIKEEQSLKEDFELKQLKASNLEAYKTQMAEMEDSFGAMIRQLPSKTEVEDLLVDISQTGLASGIEFQLFKPLAEKHIEFYAELPITLKMTGTYHQFGAFVSGIAALPRIVTLENISIAGSNAKDKKNLLTMDVTAKTYRYLDDSEVSGVRKGTAKKNR
jgi:type IV pilus assembly protein PilO